MKGLEDRIAGGIVSLAGGISLWEAAKLYRYHTGLLGGDHVFPGLVGLGLIITGILLMLRPDRRLPEPESPAEKVDRLKVAVIPAALFGYTLLLPLAGYLISTFAAAVLLFRVMGAYRISKCLLGALLTTIFLELVFVQWLHTPLPAGLLIHL